MSSAPVEAHAPVESAEQDGLSAIDVPSRRWPPPRAATFALLMGLLITAALALSALALYHANEDRLLKLRGRELSLVLAAAASPIETPLSSAAGLADATQGSPSRFRALLAPYVGKGRQFHSVSLWPLGSRHPAPRAVLGAQPRMARLPQRASQLFAHPGRPGALHLVGFVGATRDTLGYSLTATGASHGFAVYAENQLPADRRSKLQSNSAFSDLDYALYLGRSRRGADLLVTSVKRLPIQGRRAVDVVPFGDNVLTLVVTPRGSLGGSFFNDLPWIIAIVGLLVALTAAALTDRLARGRHRAERLASALDRVYTQERSISQTLQHALLPDALPQLRGLEVSARYIPAASGVDVGGDWYDAIAIDERRMLLVIGDVSGHGLRAATVMALVRHAVLAYVAQDPSPAAVLTKLSDFINGDPHDYFATVFCALFDIEEHRICAASAGHLPPLVLQEGRAEYLACEAGAPIGAPRLKPFQEVSIDVAPNARLIAFTDGLVERRAEVLDVGLARLRDFALVGTLPLEDFLVSLETELTSEDHHDDTAIVGVQWLN
jgi:serine phosphatase RsbU (regulator of sigma subunit)